MRHLGKFLALALIVRSVAIVAVEEPARTVSFEEALRAIVDRNPSVAAERANLESVRAKNLSTHLSYLPTLSLEGDIGASRSFGFTQNRLGATAKSTLNIFKFGGDAAGIRGANAEERAEELVLEDTTLKTESDGVKALLGLIQSAQDVAVLQHTQEMWQTSLRIGKERYDRGLLPSQEVDKISIDLDNAQASLRDAEIESLQAQAEVEKLLGHHGVRPEWPWKERLLKPGALSPQGTEADLNQRPDWQSAEKKVEAARARATQSWTKLMPSLDANFSYGFYRTTGEDVQPIGGPGPGGPPPTGSGNYTGPEWSGMIMLTIPLFDRLSSYGDYRAQVWAKAGAEMELEKVRRQAQSEWQSAHGAFDIAVQSARLREQTLTISHRLYQDSLARFRKGLADANELNIDQSRLYNTETNAIRGWNNAHSSFAKLCQALGRRIEKCLHD